MDNTQQHKILSLCSGSLGIEKGLLRAGANVQPVAYVEGEAFAIYNLVSQMEKGFLDAAPIWTNVRTFDAQPFFKRIHGIVGGYPCQGESNAGQRKLEKDPRFLWWDIERIIKESRPVWCFFENVASHLTGSFPIVHRSLRNLGFKVEAGIYSAAECGAPHIRKRLFILACTDIDELRQCVANPNRERWSMANITKWRKENATTNGSEVLQQKMVSHTNSKRSREGGKIRQTAIIDKLGAMWPVRPGLPQSAYEKPRLIESSMGCTIDGYNFRTDLLRLFGNAVVPVQAEIAFLDLLQKF